MIEAKIGAWAEMSLLSGPDCIVVKQESVIFFPECNNHTEIHTKIPFMFVYIGKRQFAKIN